MSDTQDTKVPIPPDSTSIRRSHFRPQQLIPIAVIIALVVIIMAVVIPVFERLPIEGTMLAVDWKSLYPGLKDGHVVYKGGSVMIAPWTLPAVLPFGFFSLTTGWAMLSVATMTVLAVSVPRRRYHMLAVLLLCISWPALREIVDGNFEVLVIAGVALLVYGFRTNHLLATAVGLLLATAKPQETWLLMIVLGIYFLRTWSLQRNFELGMSLAVVVIPAMILFGSAWIGAMKGIEPPPGTILDITLWAALNRSGVPQVIVLGVQIILFASTLLVAFRSKPILTREKAAMLVAASMLLAPYAAGDSYLTVFAIGVIPTFQSRPRLGLVLIVLSNLQFIINFISREFLYWYSAYYWTALLLLCWSLWCWQIHRSEIFAKSLFKN